MHETQPLLFRPIELIASESVVLIIDCVALAKPYICGRGGYKGGLVTISPSG